MKFEFRIKNKMINFEIHKYDLNFEIKFGVRIQNKMMNFEMGTV